MTRSFTLFCSLLPLLAFCQEVHVHLFSIDAVPDAHAVKYAHQVVLSLDPQAALSFDGDRLKVRSASATSAEILGALNSTGSAIYHVVLPIERSGNDQPPPFPEYMNTGDREGDDARYALAKQAWIVTYPEAYQRMLNASGSGTPLMNKQH